MDELISVARIGRSLGVHLILATQKPAGVVNDQIRSNAKFGVCLKVQSPSDSKDIINIPDAAKLRGSGQFYLKVGNDDYLVLGQAGWAGALYYPSNEVKKEIDNSVEFISDTGKIIKKVDDVQRNISKGQGEQLANIVKFISDLADAENIKEKSLWLEPIPETIYLKDIKEKYKTKEEDIINPVIGEYDDPSKQVQNVMRLNLSTGGNVLVYGNSESGKETLLNTIVYDIITNHTANEAQVYIIDFGSEAMKILKKSPRVGDVIVSEDVEKVSRFFMMIQKELRERKEILSEYAGDYKLYIKSTNKPMHTIVIILNGYENFNEKFEYIYDDVLETLLREGLRYRFVFIFSVSTSNGIRYRMQQNFRQKIVLQMNKDDDYNTILENVGKKRPSKLFGRGLVNIEDRKYFEFQTAKVCEPAEWNEHIMEVINNQNEVEKTIASEVKVMPEIVTINDLIPRLKEISSLPIGISYKNIETFSIDFSKNLLNFMMTNSLEDMSKFIISFIDELKLLQNINILILDAEKISSNEEIDLKKEYIQLFKSLNSEKKITDTLVIIIGLKKFLNKLGGDGMFNGSLENAEKLKKVHYIIFENAKVLNDFKFSDWYKNYSVENTGLWMGNGVDEQYLLRPNSSKYKLVNSKGNSYGYYFKKGVPYLIKLLGMVEKGEDDE